MTTGSASSSVMIFESASSADTRVTEALMSPPRSNSRTSRPSSVSLPTMAMVFLSNLLLRGFRRGSGVRASTGHTANDACDTQGNAAGHIESREREQERLAEVPDEVNGHGDGNERDWRSRFEEVDLLKAGIAPGADHQEREQEQQRHPEP